MRLQAKNIYGWGVYSAVTAVAAAGIPEQMVPPVTEVYSADNLFVRVSWVAPYDGSDAITEYKIQF